ncbi:FmdE family protein [Natrinema salaciae]|uniref:FmdE, Molybdenum formylmethanofuran dehydrogenase operon n=1 Tax=Natrinema salaciae TaxID=1186196 RepID=A0A1H9NX96_9EURY|nr:FmdE family protein [Natrinema salaciae]SER40560.1 FmdE, Molybdenum formylmethanofuran dehydrogenase operon [Natrinema salaciae]
MSQPTHTNQTNWSIDYEAIDPIRIRDPVAEALAVLEPGEPFVISYADVVTAAGHSCPTAAGAYRITQLGLEALYPGTELPVRSDIVVTAGGPKDDAAYGVMSRLVSYVTGAAEEDGFGGLAGGYGDRRNHLHFDDLEADGLTFSFERSDTDDVVRVTYHVSDVPDAGPTTQYLGKCIDGEATAEERAAFAEAWHGRVRTVLTDDDLFTVERTGDGARTVTRD